MQTQQSFVPRDSVRAEPAHGQGKCCGAWTPPPSHGCWTCVAGIGWMSRRWPDRTVWCGAHRGHFLCYPGLNPHPPGSCPPAAASPGGAGGISRWSLVREERLLQVARQVLSMCGPQAASWFRAEVPGDWLVQETGLCLFPRGEGEVEPGTALPERLRLWTESLDARFQVLTSVSFSSRFLFLLRPRGRNSC